METFGLRVEDVDEGGRPLLRGRDDGEGDDNWRGKEKGGGGRKLILIMRMDIVHDGEY
jgi:hypothetical protein